jgi:hypothetical protein
MTPIGVTYKEGSIWRNLIIIHFCNMRHVTKWFQITGEKLQKKKKLLLLTLYAICKNARFTGSCMENIRLIFC